MALGAKCKSAVLSLCGSPPLFVTVHNYFRRPPELGRFPLHFFTVSCGVTRDPGIHSLAWGPAGTSLQTKPAMSKTFPEFPLLDPDTGKPICEHEYYIQLRTQESWRVPTLYGRPSKNEKDTCVGKERGMLVLFLLMLLRPYRCDPDLFGTAATSNVSGENTDAAWERLYREYKRWRADEIDAVAAPYIDRSASAAPSALEFDTPEWWVCMVSLRLRNMDLLLSQHEGEEFKAPTDCCILPSTAAPWRV